MLFIKAFRLKVNIINFKWSLHNIDTICKMAPSNVKKGKVFKTENIFNNNQILFQHLCLTNLDDSNLQKKIKKKNHC